MASPRPQKPLELILARNLLTSVSTPAFLVDHEAAVVFYNESAAALLGRSFEDTGRMSAEEWTEAFGPFDRDGAPVEVDELAITEAIRDGRPAHGTFTIRAANGDRTPIEASAFPIVASDEGSSGAMILFWPQSAQRERLLMRVKVWGARGSVPAPGPHMNRYGGNTSCVQISLAGGDELILDAGTGIRNLGLGLRGRRRIHILLTHLHLDHIQGLMFFPPCFRAESEIVIWGPSSPEASLEDRIARYISAPLSPVEVRELPCSVSFRDTPASEWELGGATIRAEAVTHRGPTLGYRITDGDTTLAYIPDHEPALGSPLAGLEPEWISGFDLARAADLLIHDCQYTDDEYPEHVGWGHSGLSDTLTFARRVQARRLLLFHHDPLHADEFLDELGASARRLWAQVGGDASRLELAMEGTEVTVGPLSRLSTPEGGQIRPPVQPVGPEVSTPG